MNICGLKSDSRVFLGFNCSFYEECFSLFFPFSQVLDRETVSQEEKHLGIICFPDTCILRPHGTFWWQLGATKEEAATLFTPGADSVISFNHGKSLPQIDSGFPLASPAAKIKPG